ncbi:hypothetical protein [Rubrolithibacter danxiaensis]|uniref:hypothetical protein n=1 Tax=Rubrolithibacter danxiaensis TaxID=3390805 RepID=UPI003BF77FAD
MKELLLNALSFNEILKQFSIDQSEVTIKDEDLLMANPDWMNKEILKERICIEGKSNNNIINFFGTLHYNFFNQLAVFEPEFIEKTPVNTAIN